MSGKSRKPKPPARRTYGMAQAKACLSRVVMEAQTQGPVLLTYHDRAAAYVVSAEEWERRINPKRSLWEFLRNSPLRGSGVKLDRISGEFRDVEL